MVEKSNSPVNLTFNGRRSTIHRQRTSLAIGFLPRSLYQQLSECSLKLIYIEKLPETPLYSYRRYFVSQILTLNWPCNQILTTYPPTPGKAPEIYHLFHS